MRVTSPASSGRGRPSPTAPPAAPELQQLQRTVAQQRRALGQAHQQLLSIHEATQRQIGQELHDDVGQLLGGAALQAGGLALRLGASQPSLGEQARQLVQLLNQAMGRVRHLSHGLYPAAPAHASLTALLQGLAGQPVPLSSQVECVLRLPDAGLIDQRLQPPQVLQLYRIAQEALRNSLRHGPAGRVRIALLLHGQRLRLRITDNGGGMPPGARATAGVGLPSMRQRAAAIGATFSLRSRPGVGLCVSVGLDLPGGPVATATPAPARVRSQALGPSAA